MAVSDMAHGDNTRGDIQQCDTCGNHYERVLEIAFGGKRYTFDCFECAIHKLAPACDSCGCRILGHGVQSEHQLFCSAHCARALGVQGFETHLHADQPRPPR